jgi:DNA (cytosine-5)-methyltransferase 1
MIGREDKNGPQGDGINIDKSFTLNTTDRHAVAIRTAQTGANGIGVANEKSHTLDGANGQAVCFTPSSFGGYQPGVGTLRASGDGSETLIYENHAQDSRITEGSVGGGIVMATSQANTEILKDKCPTLMAGHEQPIYCGEEL